MHNNVTGVMFYSLVAEQLIDDVTVCQNEQLVSVVYLHNVITVLRFNCYEVCVSQLCRAECNNLDAELAAAVDAVLNPLNDCSMRFKGVKLTRLHFWRLFN